MRLLLCLFIPIQVAWATKWYSGGMDFNSPSSWVDDYMPCGQDLIVFPEHYPALLPLPEDISVDGIVFPKNGAILLAEESTMTFGSKATKSNCESQEWKAYLKPPKTRKWYDPGTWTDKSKEVALYVPELERIPCDNEQVIIKGHGPLAFDLENVQHLRLGQLILAGSSISKYYLDQLLTQDVGQFLFHNSQDVQVEYYRGELCGCHKDFDRLVEPVCHNVQEKCEIPHCHSPVRPYGSCCLICGAILSIRKDHCIDEDKKTLENKINKLIKEHDMEDHLESHVVFVGAQDFGKVLQAIITDRNGYTEKRFDFLYSLISANKGKQFTIEVSGSHYNPNVSFTSVVMILFCLVLVGFVSVVILAHFMPENPYLNRIPQWIHDPRRWRWHHLGLRIRRNLLFNRFDNAGAGAPEEGSGSGLDRLGIMAYDPESGEVRERRAFDNPMFEQGAAAEEAAGLDAKEQEENLVVPKMETGDLDAASQHDEQELTEINLDAGGEESDLEVETIE
ncbi:uncharacterized protein Dana_GF26805 [Drosophila ananassae]|uniref:Protein amnionless n=1 Tax=Drosophila ananassae TaxID=7217 RepID=A0A0P8XI29_DROAN|nr:protein amnionless [Drosophila ananassae]KPU74518.1 uncharacterized protein Dana_GF26805 [Drosophila ananassae]